MCYGMPSRSNRDAAEQNKEVFIMKCNRKGCAVAAACLVAAMALTACGSFAKQNQQEQIPTTVVSSTLTQPAADEAQTKTMKGVVNTIDTGLDMLILIADEAYYKFEIGDVDLTGLEPGDTVTVTYTGEAQPDSETVEAALVSVEKAE